MRWKIFYGDGTTWSNTDGPPEDAPCRDVQVIVAMDHGKRILMHGGVEGVETEGRAINPSALGYYWFENGWWTISDYLGLIDYLMRPGHKIVKFGRTIDTAVFHQIMARAIADPDFPRPE